MTTAEPQSSRRTAETLRLLLLNGIAVALMTAAVVDSGVGGGSAPRQSTTLPALLLFVAGAATALFAIWSYVRRTKASSFPLKSADVSPEVKVRRTSKMKWGLIIGLTLLMVGSALQVLPMFKKGYREAYWASYTAPPYKASAGCVPRHWVRDDRLPRTCDAPEYRIQTGTFGLNYTQRYSHWLRIGNDAYEVGCDYIFDDTCHVYNAVHGKFRQQ